MSPSPSEPQPTRTPVTVAGVDVAGGPTVPARASRPERSWGRSVAGYALTILFLVTLNFFLPRLLPGDPIEVYLSQGTSNPVDEDTRNELTRYYGLDDPLVEQYLQYLGGLAQGDLGVSIFLNREVTDLLWARLPWTLLLVSAAMAVSVGVGVTAGIHSAWRRGRYADQGLLGGFLAVSSMPAFFLASMAAYLFGVRLGWFPRSGGRTAFGVSGALDQAADLFSHLVLPAGVLALAFLLSVYLLMRGSMVTELGSDYLMAGRARGLRERRLKYGYAARNSLLPVVTEIGLVVGVAVPISIFVEQIFAYPGLGELLTTSAFSRDYPVMQGCFLLLSMLVVTANFLADALNARLDPRISA